MLLIQAYTFQKGPHSAVGHAGSPLRAVDRPISCGVVEPELFPCPFHGQSLRQDKIKIFRIRALHDAWATFISLASNLKQHRTKL